MLFSPGIVLGSFFYGYWALQIPGAWIAMKLGGTRVFGYGVLLAALLTLLTPVAARYNVGALIAVRVLEGLFLVRKQSWKI
jgi:MFS family permease